MVKVDFTKEQLNILGQILTSLQKVLYGGGVGSDPNNPSSMDDFFGALRVRAITDENGSGSGPTDGSQDPWLRTLHRIARRSSWRRWRARRRWPPSRRSWRRTRRTCQKEMPQTCA